MPDKALIEKTRVAINALRELEEKAAESRKVLEKKLLEMTGQTQLTSE